MMKQLTLSALSDELAQAKNKKEFLNQIERIVPWSEWLEIIKPHYYMGERGNMPYDMELMLRLYLLQNLYNLSDMQTSEQAIDSSDPEAHSVKKGNDWKFGYKAHVGVDSESGLVHSVEVTAANVHDVTMMPELLTGEEDVVYGDSGYIGAEKRDNAITHNKQG